MRDIPQLETKRTPRRIITSMMNKQRLISRLKMQTVRFKEYAVENDPHQ